jgi:hypothetical protein
MSEIPQIHRAEMKQTGTRLFVVIYARDFTGSYL